jgi:hypothetical protein
LDEAEAELEPGEGQRVLERNSQDVLDLTLGADRLLSGQESSQPLDVAARRTEGVEERAAASLSGHHCRAATTAPRTAI